MQESWCPVKLRNSMTLQAGANPDRQQRIDGGERGFSRSVSQRILAAGPGRKSQVTPVQPPYGSTAMGFSAPC
jgi:hypothetical protein